MRKPSLLAAFLSAMILVILAPTTALAQDISNEEAFEKSLRKSVEKESVDEETLEEANQKKSVEPSVDEEGKKSAEDPSTTVAPADAVQDRDCRGLQSQEKAQAILDQTPGEDPNGTDTDSDRVTCEALLNSATSAGQNFDCRDFQTQEEAQAVLDQTPAADPNGIDRDGDRVACESLLGTTPAQDLDCDDFFSQEEAQAVLDQTPAADPNGIDTDGDRIACESLLGTAAAQEPVLEPSPSIASTNVVQDLDCDDFFSQEEAQAILDQTPAADPNGIDRDGDRIACESLLGAAANQEPVAAKSSSGNTMQNLDCDDFQFREEAQAVLDQTPGTDPNGIDRDGDRIACESLPRRDAVQDLDCNDFQFREEAQAVLDQTPGEDPNGIDRDNDRKACESLPRRGAASIREQPLTGGPPIAPILPLGIVLLVGAGTLGFAVLRHHS